MDNMDNMNDMDNMDNKKEEDLKTNIDNVENNDNTGKDEDLKTNIDDVEINDNTVKDEDLKIKFENLDNEPVTIKIEEPETVKKKPKTVYISPDFEIPIYIPKSIKPKHKKVLILSGGGIKGISHIGVLQALQDYGYLDHFEVYAATSVGSLIIGMYLIGYKPEELWLFIKKFNLDNMKALNVWNLLSRLGLDTGIRIEYVMKRLISAKGFKPEITLRELYKITKKKLIFTTVCINTQKVCYLSHETHPNLPVYLAIRMSISIPIFYTPVEYENMMYIDGGCIDNYPIQIFDHCLEDVIGIYLMESTNKVEKIEHFETYILLVIQCLMEGVTFNSKKGYEKYTIGVNLESINIVDFAVDNKKKQDMYNRGYEAVKNYFKF